MRRELCFKIFFVFLLFIQNSHQVKKQKTHLITDIKEFKEFKKLLRTKTNVLVLFLNAPKSSKSISEIFRDTADAMKGRATVVSINCSNSESKKLCKKLKVNPEKAYHIKHYKDGEYHKDYDRSETVSALSNFLRDPTGDLPWEEDPTVKDIYHLQDGEALTKFLRKIAANKKSLIMFYAPWCGYCKLLKPEYVAAAGELKGEALLAAIDLAKPGNSKLRQEYNITGFPTLLYYDKGQYRFPYNGINKRQAIVDFMRDPDAHMVQKETVDESWSNDSEVLYLTESTFDDVLSKAEHALVVFYAPWCGHCKNIKPQLEKAAARIKSEKVNGILAAVDATRERELAALFGVKGYPTLKYFRFGKYEYDAGHARQEDQIVQFLKDPREPPPPPPPESSWSEEESVVRHLTTSNFKSTLRKIKHALVMFYAPWCGHCKNAKPEFTMAAEHFSDELSVLFGAVDCTSEAQLCQNYEVAGYPTFKYISHYDRELMSYEGGRKEADFIAYINGQRGVHDAPKRRLPTNQEAGFGTNVQLATDDFFETIIAAPMPTFVMFYATWCGHCSEAKPAFSRLATRMLEEGGRVKVVAVEASDNPKAADFAQVQTLPTFKMYVAGAHVADYQGDRSLEDMLRFCMHHLTRRDEL
ncbi:unnamed protein product, partial [Iphiclides podalirius]